MQKLKRKRQESSASDASPGRPPPKKIDRSPQVVIPRPSNPLQTTERQSMNSPVRVPTPQSSASSTDEGNNGLDRQTSTHNDQSGLSAAELTRLRGGISWQVNQEIVLKHRELRLIEQELAKCQIALEQLRRCHQIPYPGTQISLDVSNGTGPALRSDRLVQPESPAPWGVADGPYSRHYAQWLLPDPRFDGSDTPPFKAPAGKLPSKGRSTRGRVSDSLSSGRSRSSKSRKGSAQETNVLPDGQLHPKEKNGTVIHRRKSDGVMVKLVCLDCRRDDFSSTQGFINHCRIAHQRLFASHDAAADASGEPVELDETGAVIGGETQPAGIAGLVHPLIRSAHLLKDTQEAAVAKDGVTENSNPNSRPNDNITDNRPAEQLRHIEAAEATNSEDRHNATSKRKRRRTAKGPAPSERPLTFKASPLAPHLSKHLLGKGSSLDLEDIVGDARAPTDLHETSSESETDEEYPSPSTNSAQMSIRGGMQPVQTTHSPSRTPRHSGSRRSLEKDHKPQQLDSIMTSDQSRTNLTGRSIQLQGSEITLDLEPSPTNDSNQAPSLVSDDEDYEAPSGSETSSSPSESHVDLDVEVEDDDSTNGGPSTRSSAENSSNADQAPPPERASAFRRSFGKREEKHVSFVSPSPVRDVKKRGGRRKKTG
ncbi:putative ada hat complex component 1 [Phaeomoniella chlamydospora]|uniref:Putative ada hat complex component 1 n=1 Tax=Phaeomoniella chlamydospora TaxID=158046 RepID=A0A0G2ENP1_PHACM|nr:putative ada hat complex component 1 [Phaeomoniella chlamydospora]